MHSYSVQDVERVLRLSRSTIKALIDGGFVTPARGPRRQYRFSFQDLIVMRTARALTEAKVPRRRVRRALDELRQSLPETVPLSGLSICAVGEHVVVRDGTSRWQVDDGQYLLALDVVVEQGEIHVVDRRETAERELPESPDPREPRDWFDKGLELEESDPTGARAAYERAVDEDPENRAAWINLGRLLHEQGRMADAESVYHRALAACGPDALLYFNLGVLLEDLRRPSAAFEAYQSAVSEDPGLADCHYNLARLYESFGKPQHAIRHLGQYRRLLVSDQG
jgi:DNA-binding transcriptional MerR regulator